MKIIEPSVELVDDIDGQQILRKLELCGRVSHKSQPRNFVAEPRNDLARPDAVDGENQAEPRKSSEELRNNSAENFVRKVIKLGHTSVLEHVQLTFKIICDRAIQNELVRHRHASFTIESTRYVKYNELAVIQPPLPTADAVIAFRCAIREYERNYEMFIKNGEKPEIARAVLPLCTATELYMTANLRELRHILKLRTDKAAHPQMRVVAGQILDILREKIPVIVEDITS